MAAALVRIRARRGEQGVEQDVDVAHREPVIVADEVERVVGCAFDVRQVALRKPFLVPGRDAEGIDQDGASAELAPPAGGDAPEFAARVDGDGRSVEAAIVGRQQVQRNESALARARRGDGDRGPLQGPADQRRIRAPAPLAEQDAPAPGETAQEAAPQQIRPAVQVGPGTPAPLAAGEMSEPGECRLEPEQGHQNDGGRRHRQHDQSEPVEPVQPINDGAERVGVLQRPHDPVPERGGADTETRAIETEAEPECRAVAARRHMLPRTPQRRTRRGPPRRHRWGGARPSARPPTRPRRRTEERRR